MGEIVGIKGNICLRTINLGGLEWLPLSVTRGVPYATAIANNPSWRVASATEVVNFLKSLMFQVTEDMVPANFEGANWLLNNFGIWDSEWNYGTQSTIDFYYDVDLKGKTVARGTVTCQLYSEEGGQQYHEQFGHYPENSGLIKFGLIEKIEDEFFQSYSAGFFLVRQGLAAPTILSIK